MKNLYKIIIILHIMVTVTASFSKLFKDLSNLQIHVYGCRKSGKSSFVKKIVEYMLENTNIDVIYAITNNYNLPFYSQFLDNVFTDTNVLDDIVKDKNNSKYLIIIDDIINISNVKLYEKIINHNHYYNCTIIYVSQTIYNMHNADITFITTLINHEKQTICSHFNIDKNVLNDIQNYEKYVIVNKTKTLYIYDTKDELIEQKINNVCELSNNNVRELSNNNVRELSNNNVRELSNNNVRELTNNDCSCESSNNDLYDELYSVTGDKMNKDVINGVLECNKYILENFDVSGETLERIIAMNEKILAMMSNY